MKMVLLAIAVWSLTAAMGSSADVEYGEGHISGSADAIRALAKTVQAGRDLFGVNEQWGDFVTDIKENTLPLYQYQRGAAKLLPSTAFFKKGALSGTMWAKHPRDFKIGDWGCTVVRFRVIGKVSKTECLVEPTDQGSEVMLLRDLDMSKVTDGVGFVLQQPVWINKTYQYTAASGGQKTVLVLDHDAEKLQEAEAPLKAKAEAKRQAAADLAKAKEDRAKAIEAAKWRTWTDASGEHKTDAKFSGMLSGTVKLTKRDGSTIRVPLEKLSDEDKAWIKNRSK